MKIEQLKDNVDMDKFVKDSFDDELEVEGDPRTNIELANELLKPDANKKFDHITKDMVISNLTNKQINDLSKKYEPVNILCSMEGDDDRFKKVKDIFIHPCDIILNLSRSRKGFERTAMTTITKVNKLSGFEKRGIFK